MNLHPAEYAAHLRVFVTTDSNTTVFLRSGAALPPQAVVDALQLYLYEEALHGGYETAARCVSCNAMPRPQLSNCNPSSCCLPCVRPLWLSVCRCPSAR